MTIRNAEMERISREVRAKIASKRTKHAKGDPPSLQRFQNYAFREGNAPHPEQDIGIGTKKEDAG